MEIWLGIISALLFMTFAWAWKATSHSLDLTIENERLKRKVDDLRLAGGMAVDLLKAVEKAKPTPPTFDSKTSSLIRLAVSNPNENEARSAAVQACNRIHKQLNKR